MKFSRQSIPPGSSLRYLLLLGLAAAVLTAACSGNEVATSAPSSDATANGSASAPSSEVPGTDATAPAEIADPDAEMARLFTLPNASGGAVSLASYRGDSNVVVVFYRAFW